MRNPSHTALACRRFSLIEMTAVLIIVGLLMGAVLGSFNGIAKGGNVDAGARMVSSQLFLARSYAISQRTYVAVLTNSDNTAVSTWLCDSSKVCSEPVPNTEWRYLAAGAKVNFSSSGMTVTGTFSPVGADATNAIIFKPNGSLMDPSNPTIVVKDETQAKNKETLEVNWLTGKVTFQ